MYQLYIANKNYSSWSLRPWVLMSELEIPFVEHRLRFGDTPSWDEYRDVVPSGTVPALMDGQTTVWDSLAIAEYLAERHVGVWPTDSLARAWARCAAAEMHSGFGELRNRCSMSCGITVRLHDTPPALERELGRLSELWNEGLSRFGGPFLGGSAFGAVDAFFAPVAFRIKTYGLLLDEAAGQYAARLLNLASMRAWYTGALEETFRDESHEADTLRIGTILSDLRSM